MSSLPTGTVTFLFSDVEGSTRLWEEHPEGMKSALALHDNAVMSAIEENGGYLFATGGDAFSAAFEVPVRALEAAVAAQVALAESDGVGVDLRVRMAVHTGSADERDGDYFGPALNRTARLLSVGHGGQVLVSLAAAELVRDSLPDGSVLRDLGEHRLKDLSRPEHVFKLLHPLIPDDSRPLRSLDAFAHNLPVELTSFVGREGEVGELVEVLAALRMVTLTGVGGAGKTRLALQTAAQVVADYEDGVWFVELAPVTDPSQIVSAVMDALGIEEIPSEAPTETMLRWLADKRLLLVLDNCEHIVDQAAALVARVLRAGEGVSVLATSREILGVPGEYRYQVRSLVYPQSGDEVVRSTLLRYPAVRLFAERAESVRSGWRITIDNASAVARICARLDGMPLAIELAAARLAMLTAGQIAEHLEDRFRLLTGGSRTVLPRQQTLEAAIDWSYDLLSVEEKTLFRRLAVFAGGFSLEAAEALCGIEPLDQYAVLDQLGHLVDKSLVQTEESPDGVRYRMLETIRVYAREKLAESEEVESMRRRHADHFLDFAEKADSQRLSGDTGRGLSRLDTELDNLRQAMTWALEAPEPQIAQALAGYTYHYFGGRFRGTEGSQWAQRAVEASEERTPARARALLAAGTLTTGEPSREYFDEAIELARALGIDDVLERALNNQAMALRQLGRWEEAEQQLLELLKLEDHHDPAGGIFPRRGLSHIARDYRKDYAEAIRLARQALDIAVEAQVATYSSQMDLAQAYLAAGDLDQAESVLEDVDDDIRKTGYEHAPGYSDFLKSILATDRGELLKAASLMQRAQTTVYDRPEPDTEPYIVQWVMTETARLLARLGAPAVSAQLIGFADILLQSHGMTRSPREQDQLDKVLNQVKDTLRDDNFETEYQRGTRLPLGEAHEKIMATLREATITPP